MARADSSEPRTSKRPPWCSRELPTARTDMASDTTANSTGKANSHGQVTRSIRNDETKRPRMPPAPAKPDQIPTARARWSAGKLEVITDSVTGMIIAAATPATMRASRRTSTDPAEPASRLAPANSASPDSRIGLRPQRSPMAPIGRSSAARAMV